MKKLIIEDFIEKSIKIHKNKYIYDKVIYVNNSTKVIIECKEHGYFEQLPNAHMRGQGCSKCKGGTKYNLEDFIKKSNSVHNYKYGYEKSFYTDSYTMIIVECKEHGYFEQLPNNHMSGQGCPKCKGKSLSDDELLKKMNIIHNNKYDYSLVLFTGMLNKVKIICSEHGIFEQKLSNHVNLKQGCPKCSDVSLSNTDEFIEKSIKIQGHLYDYNKVVYINAKTDVEIICRKHGVFSQKPTKHLMSQGCPICKLSKGELKIINILSNRNIEFKSQYKFEKLNLVFDFYIPHLNLAIEYDGIQHFKPINYFGGQKAFESQTKRDNQKDEYCKKNNIHLLRIPYNQDIEKLLISHINFSYT